MSASATIDIGGVMLNCHFVGESEIAFDLDPREVVEKFQLDSVVDFMTVLAGATGKPAVMTPESMHDHAFIRVQPSGTAQYIPSDGFFAAMRDC